MTTRIAEPDPERSIIYLIEKLECAAESFGESAAYNMKQAKRLRSLRANLCAIVVISMLISFTSSSYDIKIILGGIASVSILFIVLGKLRDNFRDYHLCWLAHAYAAIRMKGIEEKVALLKNKVEIVSKSDVERLYDEYRSVYNDTNRMMQSRLRTPFSPIPMLQSSIALG